MQPAMRAKLIRQPTTNLVDVERSEDENEPREGRVGGDGLEPVVVDVEEDHLRLGGLQDKVSELLHLEAGLEG